MMSELTYTSGDMQVEKIKAINPQIVINTYTDKPYYCISYYDIQRKGWVIGFGSYDYNMVAGWLSEYFDIVDSGLTEVTYCAKCIHRDPENHHCDHPMGTSLPVPRKDNDFCSYGEGKTTINKYIELDEVLDLLEGYSYSFSDPPMDNTDNIKLELTHKFLDEIKKLPTVDIEEGSTRAGKVD
jgi:hypothetical protein